MKYQHVCIESFGFTLPEEIWSSDDVENRLAPLYERLKLPTGRLELMTGIKERRFWPPEAKPSQMSVQSCLNALRAADFEPASVGCLIHGSVCRDFLEPATACTVHHRTGLGSECVIYDVSNACLGILNGMLQAANMIELGQIKSALVVGSEGGRQLVETTIQHLNNDETYTRKTVKPAFASLTIGSASCAVLLTHDSISKNGSRLTSGAVTANTKYHDLCQSHQDQAGSEMAPLMATDSEQLLVQGVETGRVNFERFLNESGWDISQIDKTVCHQVGVAHQKLMLDSLGLGLEGDFVSFDRLGNTGAAALPVTLAMAADEQFMNDGDRVALLGIGSGINSVMLGVEWKNSPSLGTTGIDQ